MEDWTYAYSWPLGLDKNVRHGNCADKYILIELRESAVLIYDLSDTQDGLRCERNVMYSFG